MSVFQIFKGGKSPKLTEEEIEKEISEIKKQIQGERKAIEGYKSFFCAKLLHFFSRLMRSIKNLLYNTICSPSCRSEETRRHVRKS